MNHNENIKKCHKAAIDNGWWDECPPNGPLRAPWIADKVDLIASEGAEAIEAIRSNRYADVKRFNENIEEFKSPEYFHNHKIFCFQSFIKDTFEDEITDIYIRACDLMGFYDQQYINYEFKDDMPTRLMIRIIRYVALEYSLKPQMDYLTFCRIMFFCERIAHNEGFNLQTHIDMKLQYNSTRGKKHGKEF